MNIPLDSVERDSGGDGGVGRVIVRSPLCSAPALGSLGTGQGTALAAALEASGRRRRKGWTGGKRSANTGPDQGCRHGR